MFIYVSRYLFLHVYIVVDICHMCSFDIYACIFYIYTLYSYMYNSFVAATIVCPYYSPHSNNNNITKKNSICRRFF